MNRKILVAYDGSDLSKDAMREARKQASLSPETEVHVVSVVTPGIKSNNTAIAGNIAMDDAEFLFPELQKIKEEFKSEGIAIITAILTDFSQKNPGRIICEYSEENAIDLIIVGNRAESNVKKLLLGSVSNAIVQHAKSQVLVIK